MLNLSSEAIRRLYVACKGNDCFPGNVPVDENDRNVSIHAILEGLGLLTDGMLPFDKPTSPSEDFSSRCESHSNASAGRPPRANSESSNPSIDGFDSSSRHNANYLPSSKSAESSTSQRSSDHFTVSPSTQSNSLDSGQQNHDIGPPFGQNLDFLSFGTHTIAMPTSSLASTAGTVMEPLRNDFLFPWPGTFAAAVGTTEYQPHC